MLSAEAPPPGQGLNRDHLTLVPFLLWCLPPAGATAAPDHAAAQRHGTASGSTPASDLTAAVSGTDPREGSSTDPMAPISRDRDGWRSPSTPRLGSLQAAMASHLELLGHGGAEPLRWAITAVDPVRGLQIEGIALWTPPPAGGPADTGKQRR